MAMVALVAVAATALALPSRRFEVSAPQAAEPFKTFEELLLEHYYEEAALEQKAPEDFYLFSKIGTGGAPSPRKLAAAAAQARAVARTTAARKPGLASKKWKFIGPGNIGARVTDLAVDIEKQNTLYVAAASGGVWKSTNAGQSYKPIWSGKRTQSIGALAMGGDKTLWVGTGEANPGGGSITYGGDGVYKSTNRGKSWKNVGLRKSSTIGRLVVDPTDPKHVLVAVTGNLFIPGGERGLYETRNAGKTWKLILAPDNETTGAVDVAIDPEDPKRIYVAMWDHIRYPDRRVYAGLGSGVFRSVDGGKSFERLGPANGLPPPSPDIGRIGVAVDPQNPSRVYAIYSNNQAGAFQAWYFSDDGGDTWLAPPQAQATLADSQSVYGWWFGRVWVHPYDSNRVFVAGLPLMESTDGGLSFPISHGQIHVDQHAMGWDPHKEGRVYNGNDGGIYRSEENGAEGSWIHGPDQPWSQFFTIDVSEQDPTRINGGLQDNGSIRSWNGNSWNAYYGGDGVKNAINPKDMENVFACSQYGACGRSDNGGNTMQSIDAPRTQSSRRGWLTPIEFDPSSADVVYYAGNIVNRSEDRGVTWEPISPDLGEGEAGGEINPLYANHYGTVQAIGLNKKVPETIYAGTDNARLWKTTDLGATWTKIVDEDVLPQRWVTGIEVKLNNPDVAYVTFSGFRQGDQKAYVVVTKDGGESWTNITSNLPKAPVNELVLIRKKMYVATDLGVFVSSTKKVKWLKVGKNLPLAPVNDLRYIPKNKTLYAGTFGRGIYKIRL